MKRITTIETRDLKKSMEAALPTRSVKTRTNGTSV